VDGKILRTADKIVSGLQLISAKASELVIVTNSVGMDGIAYSADLMEYIKEMGEISRRVAEFADNVVECVYGIPVALKGSVIC
jgi:adenosylcobinamide kinase/adenosylcobinamide-phosphate guanylyltransferase